MSVSDSRKRSPLAVQLSPDERAKVKADADAVGLSLSGYARTLLLGRVTEGTQKAAPLPERQELARLLAALGKIGGNLNQLAKLGNQGQIVPPSGLADVTALVRDVAAKVRAELE